MRDRLQELHHAHRRQQARDPRPLRGRHQHRPARRRRRPRLARLLGPTGERGPDGFVANIRDLRAGFPDIHFTIDDLVAEADRVVVRWSWRATHDGPFRGLAPTHKPVTNSGIAIYQLASGQILHNWLETDRLGALQQLGALPPPAR